MKVATLAFYTLAEKKPAQDQVCLCLWKDGQVTTQRWKGRGKLGAFTYLLGLALLDVNVDPNGNILMWSALPRLEHMR